ncbi:MAG TPA: pilus assembly protein TadG-related protein [Terriglobales bacterium]|nr:pilus assembly protein TadG-related protein [Terriglobales bacterium]
MKGFFPGPLRQFLKGGDKGQALALTAVGLAVLMLMAGLGVDVGFLRYQKEQMQKAADAGAMAAASVLIYSNTGAPAITTAAQSDAAANGFQNGTNGVVVTVNNPPQSGVFAGNDNYVEVIVAQPQPTFFMKVGGFASVNVSARAVGAVLSSGNGCIYSLDPNGSESFLVNGTVSITSTCGIKVNSNNQYALVEKGNSGSIKVTNGAQIGVVGGYSGTGFSPTPTNITPFSDPLSYLQPPTVGGCNYTNYKTTSNVTLQPAVYCGGITINGNAVVTFEPGTYILMGGGMTSSGNTTLIGSGVTFYNTFGNDSGQSWSYGAVNLAGTAQTTLTAPTSGSLAGILFFQDRRVPVGTWNSFDGTNGEIYSGILYFPTGNLDYAGDASIGQYLNMIAWDYEFNGNPTLLNYNLPGGQSPFKSAFLAE